jgi:hypothetical protein
MTDEAIDEAIDIFIVNFNEMCKEDRRDFLVREREVMYEATKSIKQYKVTYKAKKRRRHKEIYAQSGFWIFKRKFPLFKITQKDKMIQFEGLYTDSFSSFPDNKITENLQLFLETCKKLPKNAFINS